MLFPASRILGEGYSALAAITIYLATLSGYLFCEVVLRGGKYFFLHEDSALSSCSEAGCYQFHVMLPSFSIRRERWQFILFARSSGQSCLI